MGVYIEAMEMPNNGETITITICGDGIVFEEWKEPGSVFKAVPVPPHGRLGDLDKLEQMFVDIDNAPYGGFDGSESFYSAEDAAQIIRLSPTIIPKDEMV